MVNGMAVSVVAAALQAQEEAGSMVSSGPAVMELANLSAKDPEETGGMPWITRRLSTPALYGTASHPTQLA